MDEVLYVSGEPAWPPVHGGRVRAAHLIQELARHLPVRVAAPLEAAPPAEVQVHCFPDEPAPRRLLAAFHPSPRLGRALLGPRRARHLRQVVAGHRPGVVMYAHSYLAAVAPDLGMPSVVDFVDLEVRRMASLARLGTLRTRGAMAAEAAKAWRWERRVARRAWLATAASPTDVDLLSTWGARAVAVPNGTARTGSGLSPVDGPVTFVASFRYAPNRDAARFLLREVWPRLQRAEPAVRLRIVGRDAGRLVGDGRGIEVFGDPESTDAFYREASVILAPVRCGGGSQVKVTEALGAGRVVVATSYSARAAPLAGRDGVVVADGPHGFAHCVAQLWRDAGERHRREQTLLTHPPVPTWEEACRPLVDALLGVVARR